MRTLIRLLTAILGVALAAMFLLWYSATWSERRLRPVRPGMSRDQVRSLVGEPPRATTRADATEAWYFNRWWSSETTVYFDASHSVSGVEVD